MKSALVFALVTLSACGAKSPPPPSQPPSPAPPGATGPHVELVDGIHHLTAANLALLYHGPADGAPRCMSFTKAAGQARGVEVTQLHTDSLCDQLGLEVGDVLTEVNGFPVLTLEQGRQVADKLREAASFEVVINRGGKALVLRYQVAY